MKLISTLLVTTILLTLSPLYSRTVHTLDIVQSGYSIAVLGESSAQSPLSFSLEMSKSEDSFLDYGLNISYMRTTDEKNIFSGALSFNFTLVKQDFYIPISLYITTNLIVAYGNNNTLNELDAFESGLGYSGSILLQRVEFLSRRNYLLYGCFVELQNITFTSESSNTLSPPSLPAPYNKSEAIIGITIGLSRRPQNLNQGLAITYSSSLLYSFDNYFRVRFGVNFTSFKESL